jgi:predicted RNA-binding Zn-ribbon protein involved in translation (DUF1610 family)
VEPGNPMSARTQLFCVILFGLALAAATSRFRHPYPAPASEDGQCFLYCSECGLEMTYPGEMRQRQVSCPHCGIAKKMQESSYSRTNGHAPPLPTNWLVMAGVFAVPVGLATGLFVLRRRQELQTPLPDAEASRFSCPGCGHEIASKSYSIGSTAVCPACAEVFVVADPSATIVREDGADSAGDFEDEIRPSRRRETSRRRKRHRS